MPMRDHSADSHDRQKLGNDLVACKAFRGLTYKDPLFFAILMVVASISMIKTKKATVALPAKAFLLEGPVVGGITGFV